MRTRKKLAIIGSVCLSLILMLTFTGACAAPEAPTPAPEPTQEKWTIRYSTIISTGAQLNGDIWLLKNIEENSGGRIRFETYLGGILAKGGETLEATRTGLIDMPYVIITYNKAELPLSQLVVLGYLTENSIAHLKASYDLDNTYEPVRKEWADHNLIVLAPTTVGPPTGYLQEPAPTLADIKGLKLRCYSYTMSFAFDKWGAVPTGMPLGEVYVALERGVVDGVGETSMGVGYYMGYTEIAPYVADWGVGNCDAGALCIRKDLYDELPQDLQEVILEWSDKLMTEQRLALLDEYQHAAVDEAIELGRHLNVWSDAEKAKAKAMVVPDVHDKWIEEVDALGVDGRAALDAYKELLTKYEAMYPYQQWYEYWAEQAK